jgi:hypothetical protein
MRAHPARVFRAGCGDERPAALTARPIACDIRRMVHDRLVQPRQIYASTLTRRDRRWARRRGRGMRSVALMTAATLVAALSALAIMVPGVA